MQGFPSIISRRTAPVRRLARRAAGGLALLLLLAAAPAAAAPAGDLLGVPARYVTREQDTLLDIAREYDLGYVAIRAANPDIDPWLPGAGKTLSLPTVHILPVAARQGIVINLPEQRIYYFAQNGEAYTFPIGIGDEGKATPVGHTKVMRKRAHPTWTPTASEHAEDPDLPKVVPAGPDNPMGDYALYLGWSAYAIHGTNKPDSIGRRDSHGCIRLYPDDIATLYRLVPVGTPVTVVNQPAKVGWSGGELYLEVHPDQDDADALETTGKPHATIAFDADALILKAAGNDADRLDWYAIQLAEQTRTGVALQITRPRR